MRSPESRAQALAERLTAALGAEARTHRTPDTLRVEVDVPATVTAETLAAIVVALGAADRYGHDVTGDRGVAWAEISLDRTEPPGPGTPQLPADDDHGGDA